MNKLIQPILRTVCLMVVAGTLSSCLLTQNRLVYPEYEGVGFTEREPTEREKLIMRSDFSMEVVRVVDARRARSTAMDAPDAIIYEYEPNDLLQGVTFRAPVLFNKYMATKPRDPLKHYKTEIVIREIKTQILAGDLFAGRMGRYRSYIDADVLVRRPDSLVVVNRPYSIELDQPRKSYNGRQPTAEMDRARTYDLLEDSIRQLAERVAWDVRMTDARRWDPYAEVRKADKAAAAEAARAEKAATGGKRFFGLMDAKQDAPAEGFTTDVEAGFVGEDGQPMMAPREELIEPMDLQERQTPQPENYVPSEPVMPENLGWGVGS